LAQCGKRGIILIALPCPLGGLPISGRQVNPDADIGVVLANVFFAIFDGALEAAGSIFVECVVNRTLQLALQNVFGSPGVRRRECTGQE